MNYILTCICLMCINMYISIFFKGNIDANAKKKNIRRIYSSFVYQKNKSKDACWQSVRLLLYKPSKSQEFAIELAAALNQHRPHEQDDSFLRFQKFAHTERKDRQFFFQTFHSNEWVRSWL